MREAKEAKKARETDATILEKVEVLHVPEEPKVKEKSPYPCPSCLRDKVVRMDYHYLNTLHEHSYCYVSIEYKCSRCKKVWIQEMPQLRQWSEDARGERGKGYSYE